MYVTCSFGVGAQFIDPSVRFNYDTECGSNHGTYRVRHSLLELSWMCLVFWPRYVRSSIPSIG